MLEIIYRNSAKEITLGQAVDMYEEGIANYVLENETNTAYLDLFSMEIED